MGGVGSGRRRNPKSKHWNLHIRLNKAQYDMFEDLSELTGKTKTELILKAVKWLYKDLTEK